MPYGCEVLDVTGTTIVLRVEPEQPDCEAFYVRADFALALLLGEGSNELARTLGDEAWDELAAGALDPSPFVVAVDAAVERRGSVRDDRAPVARYTIRTTDARWLSHLARGACFDSYAWSEATGPRLADAEVFEPSVPLPVGVFAVGDRVSLHAELGIGPGELCGRATVEASATAERPRGWDGGEVVYRVAFDHGPCAWAFAETLRVPPADTYERAARDPARFFDELLARPPLERARALRFLALRGGGDLRVRTEGDRAFDLAVAANTPWMFGLLRRLPAPRAVEVATALVADWLGDPAGCATKFGRPVPGVELAAGDTIEAYQFEYCGPIELTVGALSLVVAETRAPISSPRLRAALERLPAIGFGYPPAAWNARIAYALAACDGGAPALPGWVLRGRQPLYDRAAALGLAGGAWIAPSDLDRFRA